MTSNTPLPTFSLVQAENDSVHVENSIFYYLALKNAHVPAELHLVFEGRSPAPPRTASIQRPRQ